MINRLNCLVTGATGYLGTTVVEALYARGYYIRSLVLPNDDTEFISKYSEVYYGDVCDIQSLEKAMDEVDIVIHLAGIIDISSRNKKLMRHVNVGGTRNVAELCMKNHIKMIYSSSVHAIDVSPDSQRIVEVNTFDPDKIKGTYGKTKAEATKILLEMTKNGLDIMIAFPSGIIGPFERKLSNIGQLISDFLCNGLKVYIDGKYNFVDVRDVAGGICGMIEHWESGGCYILSGHIISVKEMITAIAKASNLKIRLVKLPYWLATGTSYLSELYYFILRKKPLFTSYSIRTLHDNCQFSNNKAQKRLGFTSRPSEESLSDMTKWIMSHFVVPALKGYKPCSFKA